jgi:deferrochelatase/peroxidase EfeB
MVNRHRLLRRGRPYGPLLPDPVTEDDGADRGLVFICLNANIARQFEFVQQTWLNDPKFHGLYDNKDPIVGDNFDTSLAGEGTPPEGGPDIPYRFTIQGEPFRQRIQGIPRFVHVRGGGYFFLPGKAALRFLAQPLGGGAR